MSNRPKTRRDEHTDYLLITIFTLGLLGLAAIGVLIFVTVP